MDLQDVMIEHPDWTIETCMLWIDFCNYKNYNGNEGIAIYVSRYTPGLENGKDIDFEIGEHVKYKSLKDGIDYGDVIIDSMRMSYSEMDKLGYEAIFPDGRFFIAAEGIYDWEGRVA